MRNSKLINIFGTFFYVLLDAIQIAMNMFIPGRTADVYSSGYSHVENYFDAFALKKTIRAQLLNNLIWINTAIAVIKVLVLSGNFEIYIIY